MNEIAEHTETQSWDISFIEPEVYHVRGGSLYGVPVLILPYSPWGDDAGSIWAIWGHTFDEAIEYFDKSGLEFCEDAGNFEWNKDETSSLVVAVNEYLNNDNVGWNNALREYDKLSIENKQSWDLPPEAIVGTLVEDINELINVAQVGQVWRQSGGSGCVYLNICPNFDAERSGLQSDIRSGWTFPNCAWTVGIEEKVGKAWSECIVTDSSFPMELVKTGKTFDNIKQSWDIPNIPENIINYDLLDIGDILQVIDNRENITYYILFTDTDYEHNNDDDRNTVRGLFGNTLNDVLDKWNSFCDDDQISIVMEPNQFNMDRGKDIVGSISFRRLNECEVTIVNYCPIEGSLKQSWDLPEPDFKVGDLIESLIEDNLDAGEIDVGSRGTVESVSENGDMVEVEWFHLPKCSWYWGNKEYLGWTTAVESIRKVDDESNEAEKFGWNIELPEPEVGLVVNTIEELGEAIRPGQHWSKSTLGGELNTEDLYTGKDCKVLDYNLKYYKGIKGKCYILINASNASYIMCKYMYICPEKFPLKLENTNKNISSEVYVNPKNPTPVEIQNDEHQAWDISIEKNRDFFIVGDRVIIKDCVSSCRTWGFGTLSVGSLGTVIDPRPGYFNEEGEYLVAVVWDGHEDKGFYIVDSRNIDIASNQTKAWDIKEPDNDIDIENPKDDGAYINEKDYAPVRKFYIPYTETVLGDVIMRGVCKRQVRDLYERGIDYGDMEYSDSQYFSIDLDNIEDSKAWV